MKFSIVQRMALLLALGAVLFLGGCDLFNDDGGGGGNDDSGNGDQAAITWTSQTPTT